MERPPSGTVTFLFTDIEGSTALWERFPQTMGEMVARHDAVLREATQANRGRIVKTTGDGVHAAFASAVDAIRATLTAQSALRELPGDLEIKVRMGLHTGEAEARDGDFFGSAPNRAARIMSAGHGGQILVSDTTASVVREHLPNGASLRDLGKHLLRGFELPEHIFQLLSPNLPEDFPALQTAPTVLSNLPPQLTSFIGRERELAEAREKLTAARLLTLIGPGGTGKSRLALQLASNALPDFSDGVWLVELASVTDPAFVLPTITSVFALRPVPGMSLELVLFNFLHDRKLLLVLDNCEHLIEACAGQVERMLRAAAGLKIVASSREALGISGEIIYRVPSLSLPEVDSVSAETLAASEAVQLFLERARAASPGFRLAAKNAPAVATICRRLDGIPLALELAAARLAVFSAEQIAARLDDRFKLLTGGSRTALPRQQTLRALIDWSYDMLTEEERALLRRLSVFAGGWTFEAAEVTLPDLKVLDLLPQLANKSLVAVEDSGEEPRYRLLETVRQYARDRLLDMGEGERTRRRHAAYFTQFVETHARRLRGDAAMTSVHLLEAEHDNLRAALAWSLDQDLDAMLRLITAMSEFWFRRGFEAEGRAWIQDALKRHEESAPLEGEAAHRRRQGVAGALQVLAWLTFSQGDYRGAFEASRRCEALARELGDLRLLSTLLSFMASALLMAGDVTAAETLAAEGLEAARKSEDPVAVGVATGMLGWRLSMHGRYDEADAHLEEGLALLRKSGDQFSVLMLLFGFGMNARWQGRLEEARAKLGELLPMFEGLGDHHRANMVRSEIGHIDRAEGNLARAAAVYRQTIVEWQRLGHRAAVAHQLESFAGLSLADRHHERAARLFGAAESLREQIGIPMTAVETVSYQEEVAALRAALGEAQIASFWQEGRRLTMEQAIGFALEQA